MYKAPFIFRNGHLNTIYSYLFRSVPKVRYERLRINTPDQDFLDLDFSNVGASSIVLITHGLEGNSQTAYMRGMVKAANAQGWDAVAMNQRGCSGEPNLLYSSYHSGKTDDIQTVVDHLLQRDYQKIYLLGYSLGGNIMLKYAGEQGSLIPQQIIGVADV